MKYDESGININTKNILFNDDFYTLLESELGTLEYAKILFAIDTYTRMIHKNIFEKMLLKLEASRFNIDLSKIKYNEDKKQHEYKLENGKIITFDLLSDMLDADKKILDELESNKRKRKCHSRSISLGDSTKDSVVLTGTITVGDRKVLHSVVEANNKQNKPVILDWTRNLVIDKESYIKLFKFDILTSVDSKLIFDDLSILKELGLDVKQYLVFRDELMKDVEKNSQIFYSEDQNEFKKAK